MARARVARVGPAPTHCGPSAARGNPLDDAKERTVAQIAGILDVPRITIYRHVAQSTRASATVAENGSAAIDFQPGGPPRESDVLLRPRLVDATGSMMLRCSLHTEFDLSGVLSGTVSWRAVIGVVSRWQSIYTAVHSQSAVACWWPIDRHPLGEVVGTVENRGRAGRGVRLRGGLRIGGVPCIERVKWT